MYTLRKVLLSLAVVTACAALARSADDDQKIIAREDAIEIMLLRQDSVQTDLRLSDEQRKKVHEFATKQWRKVQELKDVSKDERDKKFEAMAKENQGFLKSTLQPEQQKRLNQIAMQRAGLLWVMRSDVASQLKLTDDQKKRLRDAHREAEKEVRDALHSGGEVRDEKFDELHKKNRHRLMSILTDDQKTRWKEMTGEKFTGKLHFGPRKEK